MQASQMYSVNCIIRFFYIKSNVSSFMNIWIKIEPLKENESNNLAMYFNAPKYAALAVNSGIEWKNVIKKYCKSYWQLLAVFFYVSLSSSP